MTKAAPTMAVKTNFQQEAGKNINNLSIKEFQKVILYIIDDIMQGDDAELLMMLSSSLDDPEHSTEMMNAVIDRIDQKYKIGYGHMKIVYKYCMIQMLLASVATKEGK